MTDEPKNDIEAGPGQKTSVLLVRDTPDLQRSGFMLANQGFRPHLSENF